MPRRSPLALTVLALLASHPMAQDDMQVLVKGWEKDGVIRCQQASLHKTVNRLRRAGLIRVKQPEGEDQRPEQTIYELTAEGRAAATRWLAEIVSVPQYEYPEFPAALSFLMMVPPLRALELLDSRRMLLEQRVAELDAAVAGYAGIRPQAVLMEFEYARTLAMAEARWLAEVIADLRSGRKTWSKEVLEGYSADHDHFPDVTE